MIPHFAGWLILAAVGTVSLATDFWLGVRRDSHGLRPAVVATIAWTIAGLAFSGVVAAVLGGGAAGRYFTVFVLEKTLSLDNVAVFAVVLAAFAIPAERRQRVLVGGILAALVLRLALVAGGLAVVDVVHDVLIVFGVILLVAGIRMVRPTADHDGPPMVISWLKRQRIAPTAAALGAIGVADLVFAIDSVPAAFAITRTSYVVVAANVFSVLGLRPLYDVLEIAMSRLAYLERAVGVLLCLIGLALCVEPFHGVPEWLLLAAVLTTIATGVIASLVARHRLRLVDGSEEDP